MILSLDQFDLEASLIHEYALGVDLTHLHRALLPGNLELGISDDTLEFVHLFCLTRASYLAGDGCSQDLPLLLPEAALGLTQIVVSYCSFELAGALLRLFGRCLSSARPLALGHELFVASEGRVSLDTDLQS